MGQVFIEYLLASGCLPLLVLETAVKKDKTKFPALKGSHSNTALNPNHA